MIFSVLHFVITLIFLPIVFIPFAIFLYAIDALHLCNNPFYAFLIFLFLYFLSFRFTYPITKWLKDLKHA
jgi:hypothetical protein